MDISDEKLLQISLIENIQREDLNPIEEGLAYERLLKEFAFNSRRAFKNNGKIKNYNNKYNEIIKVR